MILRSEELKDIASKILLTVDSNELSVLTETLEMKAKGKTLFVNVTNREYYAQVKLSLDEEETFHATVNANLFLKLISQITTDCIELITDASSLTVKGNGTYKLPLIFDNDKLLELPEININNPTVEFDIDSAVLLSILNYNSKELTIGTAAKAVQRLYYIDEQGAITFTSGACVNNFTLEKPVKMLLNSRLVKLFKLFKTGKTHFTLGYDALSDEIIQTKVRFESPDIVLTAITSCDDTLLNSVPVSAIRGRACSVYPYSVSMNKDNLIQAINRLLLFSSKLGGNEDIKSCGNFEFGKDSVTIYDVNKENKEILYYNNTVAESLVTPYTAVLDMTDLKKTLDGCSEQYLNINFGDESAIVIARQNVYNVIPECGSYDS